jgi:hypothetical protein
LVLAGPDGRHAQNGYRWDRPDRPD